MSYKVLLKLSEANGGLKIFTGMWFLDGQIKQHFEASIIMRNILNFFDGILLDLN